MMSLLTERGHEFFVNDGYKYTLGHIWKSDASKATWRCEFKNGKTRCPAQITVQNNTVISRRHEHTHESNPAGIQVTQIRNTIKRRAVETVEVRSFIKQFKLF